MAVVGGGAAGFMTAITAAENGVKRIIILEGTSKLMEKVRISGGGRCNVTNATWIPNELVENYPRGGIQLLESFNRFAAGDVYDCLLYTSPSPRDLARSRMPSSA